MSRWAVAFYAVVSLVLMAYGVTFAYYAWYEKSFLSFTNLPFPVIPAVYRAGDTVGLMVGRCSTDSHPQLYPVTRRLVCGSVTVDMASNFSDAYPGCRTTPSYRSVLPSPSPTGRCHIEGIAQPSATLRSDSVLWTSQEFEVTP